MTVITRFPPSPTGYLHIGGARTALFNWLYARHQGGRFILRIEDTDRERSTTEAVQAIIDGMEWLGLDWDEGPIFQTDRMDRYKAAIDRLLTEGKAYHCYCSKERLAELRERQIEAKEKPRYDGRCRKGAVAVDDVQPVVRFKNPEGGDVVIDDRIRGRVVIANHELDDLILARADGSPTYHLTVVVDDIDMGITHVVRGDDHLNNTPRQINIIEALGEPRPVYAHVPMINGQDGKRLSKRHGAISVLEYRDQGILPEALLNYLVRLGWSHGDQEIFSRQQMIDAFDIDQVNKSAASFDPEKLLWVNQHYLQSSSTERLAEALTPYFEAAEIDLNGGPPLDELIDVQRDRAKTLVELVEKSTFFYRDYEDFEGEAAKKHLRPVAEEPLRAVRDALTNADDWSTATLNRIINAIAEKLELKLGKIAQPLRVAVTGSAASPGIDVTLYLMGQDRCLAGIDRALEYIAARKQGQ